MIDAVPDTTTDTKAASVRARMSGVEFRRAGEVVRGFLHWWWGELKAILPHSVTAALVPARSIVTVFDRGASFDVLVLSPDGNEKKLDDVPWSPTNSLSELTALLAGADDAQVRLQLAPSRTLSTDIDLPKMSAADRGRAAQLRYESELPLNADAAWHTHRVLTVGDASERIRLYAAHRREVDGLTDQLSNMGLPPGEVLLRDDHTDGPGDVQFAGAGVPVSVRVAVRDKLLGFGPFLILLLALLFYAVRLDMADARIASDVAGASAELKGLAELTDAFEQDRRMEAFLGEKLTRPAAATIIDEITGALPDDAWLSGLQLSGREIRLTGFAANPSDLVAPLEALETFDSVRLTSASVPRAEGNRRQFKLTLDVAGAPR